MTLLGFVFIPLGLWSWLFRPALLFPLTIVAAFFQAGAVLVFGDFAVSPYGFLGLLILTRLPLSPASWRRCSPVARKILVPLLFFLGWSVLSAVLMPGLFRGMPVLDSRIESLIPQMTPLTWSAGNLAQACWLTVNVGVTAFAALSGDFDPALKAYRLGCKLVLAVIVLQLVVADFWSSPLPLWLFHSNVSQGQSMFGNGHHDRPNSLFSEPSVAGALVTALALYTLANFLEGGSIWLCVISLVTLLIIRSTASLGAFAAGFAMLGPNRLPFTRSCLYLSPIKLRRWTTLILALGLAVLIVVSSPTIMQTFMSITVDKPDSDSYLIRVSYDLAGLQAFAQTWGLGVGLGILRTSSLLATMLGTVGIVGTALFVWFIVVLLRAAPSAYRWLLAGALLAQVFGVPDINLAVLWVTICIVLLAALRQDRVLTADSLQPGAQVPSQ